MNKVEKMSGTLKACEMRMIRHDAVGEDLRCHAFNRYLIAMTIEQFGKAADFVLVFTMWKGNQP